MRNVNINYGESIFEPFWDCGESYPNHEKFSPMSHYKTSALNETAAFCETWCGVRVSVMKASDGDFDFVMCAECDMDASEYDRLRLFAVVPRDMKIKVSAVIDGKVFEESFTGKSEPYEYLQEICGNKMTSYSIAFKALKGNVSALLSYSGFADAKRVEFMENQHSPYDAEWEGCFAENYSIAPQIGLYFNNEELKALREKIKKEPFCTVMKKLRNAAEENMNICPEENIATYIMHPDSRWVSMRDRKRETYFEVMDNLAFVGIVDENYDMLRMACRMALSAAHCGYWCESVMGVFPGATWHHRSFTEGKYLRSCAAVLDWAGGLLTWHGKHIIQDAMIMKGMPRIESDFMTVDYIRHMNQGIVFSSGRIAGLIALSKDYPRYEKRLEEAERDLFEMLDSYFEDDGGIAEGPAYLNYTLLNILPIMFIIAKKRNCDIWEVLPEKVKRSMDFGLCMLSDAKDGRFFLPVNDTHEQSVNPIVASVFSQHSEPWKKIYFKTLEGNLTTDKEFLIMAEVTGNNDDGAILGNGLLAHTTTGQVSYRRESCKTGRLHLHLVSGITYFAHTHADKGSFILELDGEPVLIDRGVASYAAAYTEIENTCMHNCFAPYEDNKIINQPKYDVSGGVVTECRESDGDFIYETDLRGAWEEERFEKLLRRMVLSEDELTITDVMESKAEQGMYFCLNTRGEILPHDDYIEILTEEHRLKVFYDAKNIERIETGEFGLDEKLESVNRLAVFYKPTKNMKITTKIKPERRKN